MKKILLLLGVLLGLGCSSIQVHHDYERGVDWSAYRTYNFFPDMETGLSELDARRLTDAVDEVLRERGYQQSEESDLLLNIYSAVYENGPPSTVGIGMGGTGGNVGGGVSVGIPVSGSNLSRAITFDLLDAASKSLLWQGVSTDSFHEGASPEQREERFMQIAQRVFAKFPPGR
jgi:hypothetical protein